MSGLPDAILSSPPYQMARGLFKEGPDAMGRVAEGQIDPLSDEAIQGAQAGAGAMVGMSKHTLYGWKKKFDVEGPAGLMDQPHGAPRGRKPASSICWELFFRFWIGTSPSGTRN